MHRAVLYGLMATSALTGAPAFAQDAQPTASPAGPGAAPAQSPANADALGGSAMQDIVVTAQRRSESVQRVPIAITAVGGATLQTRGLTNLQDFSGALPSVNVQSKRSAGVITIRGIGFDLSNAGADPGVATHQDGVYIARPAAALAGFYDVERLEVARGPQGTLYGRNATGGAVNIISRAPTEDFSGYLDGTFGNYNTVAVEGAVSGPLVTDTLLARFSFKVDTHDGYGKNIVTGADINDLNSRAFRAQLLWKPSSNFKFALRGDDFHERDAAYTPIFTNFDVPCATAAPLRRCGTAYGGTTTNHKQDVAYDFNTIDRRDFWGLSGTADWDLGGVQAKSITAYRRNKYFFAYDTDGTSQPFGYLTRVEDSKQFSQELQLTNGKTSGFQWVLGGYYFHENNVPLNGGSLLIPDIHNGGFLFNNTGRLLTNAYAVFGQASYDVTRTITLTAGGRYSIEKRTIADEISQSTAASHIGPLPSRSITFKAFTPKFAINYKPTGAILLYVSAQKGFKSGNFVAGNNQAPYKPETIWAYEAGLKATWLGGRLRTNISAFHYDYKDLQVSFIATRPDGSLLTQVTNAANSKIDGIEGEFGAKLFRGFSIDGNAAWLKARFANYTTIDPNRPALGPLDLSGNRLGSAPRFTFFLGAQYEWPAFAGKLTLRGEYNHVSKTYFDAYNVATNFGPAYSIGNAFLNYAPTNDRWSLGLYVKNISDKSYKTGSIVTASIVGAPVAATFGAPRTFGAKIGLKF